MVANLDYITPLGVEADDTADMLKMQKVDAIVGFFKGYADGKEMIRRVASRLPRGERVDRVYEYMQMRTEHDTLAPELAGMEAQMVEKKRRLDALRLDLGRME